MYKKTFPSEKILVIQKVLQKLKFSEIVTGLMKGVHITYDALFSMFVSRVNDNQLSMEELAYHGDVVKTPKCDFEFFTVISEIMSAKS